MGKKTTKNTVAWSTPPATPATTQLQSMVGQADHSTSIRNRYARAERELDQSYRSPLGAYTTADVEDKAKRAQKFDLKQNMGADLANANLMSQNQAFNQQAAVAQLMQPRMYNDKSTYSDPFGSAMQIASLAVGATTGGLNAKR